jgi:SAM-dependent methyltransferase
VQIARRLSNIIKYGIGESGYRRKHAEKARIRDARFRSGLWNEQEDVAIRNYASYDEYVAHQASKLDRIIGRLRQNEPVLLTEFVERFKGCVPLKAARSVLCLGARVGTEVAALHSLGYFAVGIDLNPGPNNRYVLPGDFHNLVFPDDCLDAIYTNSLDHAFDLPQVIGEVHRVLRPSGLFVADVLAGFEEGFIPGEYEATHWRSVGALLEKIREIGDFAMVEVRPLGSLWRGEYTQAVLRKRPD